MSSPDLSEFQALTEAEELRAALSNTQRALKRAKGRSEDLVAATLRGAKEAMLVHGPIKPVPAPTRDRRKGRKPEVALWHLTDWQGSKVTSTYSSEIMRERILRYCDKAKELTDIQRAHHPVRECVVMFGGDLVEGLFNYPTQAFEIDSSLFGQYVFTSRLVVDVVRRALADHDKVTVIDEYGNHGRVGSKRATVPLADNFDRMIHHLARELLAGESRLTWEDCPEDIKHVQIGSYRALLIHGDEIGRNGFASKNTIVAHCNRWRSGGHPWEFQDVYLGHYHTPGEEVLANGTGSVYWTGAPESDNRYAGVRHASAGRPSQRLHFIEPQKGEVTAQYAKVWLDK